MKHSHIIEAESAEEFAQAVASLNQQINGSKAATTEAPAKPATTPAAPAKGKKGTRKPEAAPSESLPVDEEEETEEADAVSAEAEESDPFSDDGASEAIATKEITFEDIKQWGTKVNSQKGIESARALLKKFGAQKPSEIKKEDYAKFVKECEKVLSK